MARVDASNGDLRAGAARLPGGQKFWKSFAESSYVPVASSEIWAQHCRPSSGKYHQSSRILRKTREDAFELLLQHAAEHGANAVIGMRYDATPKVMQGVTEVLAYGTAVQG